MAGTSADSYKTAAESPLESEIPICDAHHHLWQRAGERYLLENLLGDIASGHHVVATVAVECKAMYRADGPEELKPVGETEFLDAAAKQAAADPSIGPAVAAAIIGFADLTLGDGVAPVLEAHMAASPDHFRGIRYSTTWDPSGALRSDAAPNAMSESSFRRGFSFLKRYRLNFDAWLYHTQLSELAVLARAFPDVVIILDHIGGPLGAGPYAGKQSEVFEVWRRGVSKVAECPNVMVKLGGLGSDRSGFDWHRRAAPPLSSEIADAIEPYFEFCIEKFGANRCMFESNFPVEKRANSYLALWNAFKLIARCLSSPERAALFHDTAFRVYRLGTEHR